MNYKQALPAGEGNHKVLSLLYERYKHKEKKLQMTAV